MFKKIKEGRAKRIADRELAFTPGTAVSRRNFELKSDDQFEAYEFGRVVKPRHVRWYGMAYSYYGDKGSSFELYETPFDAFYDSVDEYAAAVLPPQSDVWANQFLKDLPTI